jgi:hypothetical protein
VFALVLPGCVPLEYQVTLLESFLFTLPVKGLLDLLLMMVGSVQDLLSDLLHFHHLVNSSEHMVRFPFKVLEEIRHRQGEMSGENDLYSINQLER